MRGNLLLLLASLIWGTAFVAQSVGMDHIGPFTFMAARSIIGALSLVPVILLQNARKKHMGQPVKMSAGSKRSLLRGGILCGLLLTVAANLQQAALLYTTTGKAGFLTALYILLVPIAGIFMGRRVVPAVWLAIAVAAIGLYLLINKTRLGMKIRAGAFNRDMTESLGINIKLIHAIVFALGVALATVAGMVAAPISSVYPNMGSQVLIMCFVVVVIGGIGSVRGALISALLVGLVDTFGKVLLPQVSGMLVYMLMAAVLLWKPEGLFKQ